MIVGLHQLKRFRKLYRNVFDTAETFVTLVRRSEMDRLRNSERYQCPGRLVRFGYKVYSQSDEDGIIAEIISRVGTTNKYFVELGVGDGLENNTLALLLQGWQGLWIEGDGKNVSKILDGLKNIIEGGQLVVKQAFITRDNIDSLLRILCPYGELDLLSIDLDGNDFHVLKGITSLKPRIIVTEYNSKFPPPISYCMRYDETHRWNGSDHFGASLSFLVNQLAQQSYLLVACNLTGNNAFFVREDLIKGLFAGPFTAEFHYEPARYELLPITSGHPASYKTVNQCLSE